MARMIPIRTGCEQLVDWIPTRMIQSLQFGPWPLRRIWPESSRYALDPGFFDRSTGRLISIWIGSQPQLCQFKLDPGLPDPIMARIISILSGSKPESFGSRDRMDHGRNYLNLHWGPNHFGLDWLPNRIIWIRTGSWPLEPQRIVASRTGAWPKSFRFGLDPSPNHFESDWIVAYQTGSWSELFQFGLAPGLPERTVA